MNTQNTATPERIIKFSQNWNGKLRCKYFTTIRLESPYYQAGNYYQIWTKEKDVDGKNKDVYHCIGRLENVITFYIDQLPEITAVLDTGYSLTETIAMLKKMYSGTDFTKKKIALLLIQNIQWGQMYG